MEKKFLQALNKDSWSSLETTLKNKSAQLILNTLDKQENEDSINTPPKKERPCPSGNVQEFIPLLNMQDGIFRTVDNRYVSFFEVLPINYYTQSVSKQNFIIKNFRALFQNGARKIQLKCMTDNASPSGIAANVYKNCKNLDNPAVVEGINSYLHYLVTEVGKKNISVSRFFVIYEYDSDEKSNDFEVIKQEMIEQRSSYINVFKSCGNAVIEMHDPDAEAREFLYFFFNRNTSRTETVELRRQRLEDDTKMFNELTGKHKVVTINDIVAPKGLDLSHPDYVIMDGMYYGFLGLLTNSFPDKVNGTWVDNFKFGSPTDIDIIATQMSQESTMVALNQYNKVFDKFTYFMASTGRMSQDKTNANAETLDNNRYIHNAMLQGENMYNVHIIITVKAETEKKLGTYKRYIMKEMKKYQIYFDEGRYSAEEYLKMTMPFLFITEPAKRLRHQMVTHQMMTLYTYTNYQLYDPRGFYLGCNADSRTMVALNFFNRSLYNNGNLILIGTSGAGKTFLQQVISERSLYNGIRSFFIIPKKGYEYARGCKLLGGTYVSLTPGSSSCLNIMEIRPEGELDRVMLDDDVVVQNSSLLAKKVTELVTWLQLLNPRYEMPIAVEGLIMDIIHKIYKSYGITDDNDSIFLPGTTVIKKMPIIQDMYDAFSNYEILSDVCLTLKPFVNGIYKNFNGQTNVDMNNQYIVFDVDEDSIGEKLHPALLYLAFVYVYSATKEDVESRDYIILDEVWKMMQTENSAKQVQNMIRLVRAYGTCALIATQQLNDFMSTDFGKSVLANTQIKMVLGLQEEEIKLVKDQLNLSKKEQEDILGFSQGDILIFSKGDRIKVHMSPSQLEEKAFSNKRAGDR